MVNVVKMGSFSSVVVDVDDLVKFLDEFVKHPAGELTPEERRKMADNILRANNLPLVSRGAQTQWVFDWFKVTTPMLGVIVRGKGPEVLAQIKGG